MDYHTKGTDKSSCQGRSLTLLGVNRKPFYSSLFHGIRVHFNFAPGSQQKWYQSMGGVFMDALGSDTQVFSICVYSGDPEISPSVFE